ncbi:MAG TPA: type II toxin-antitoxin system prevent-host-death family antitoxin [Devosia sp.]|nr:type II toxin-antitoxin system prevent-host-death family antitoxin [Devosia sp.]
MKQVGLAEAKARLSELVADVEGGASIEISKRGKVVAMIVPVQRPTKKIDIERLRRHQARFTSPPQPTEESIRDWKDDDRH